MARNMIFKRDGTPTPYFWMDKDGTDRTHQIVYKKTEGGVKKMRGVHFDVEKNKMRRE